MQHRAPVTNTRTARRDGRRTGGRLVVLLVLALVCEGELFAEELDAVLDSSGYAAEERVRIREIHDEARARGIPTTVLVDRIQEGIAKAVPAPRLVAALRDDVLRLETVRSLLGDAVAGERILADPASWERAATLLRAGWPAERLMQLAAICEPRPEAFRAASLLWIAIVDWGASQESAEELTSAAVESGIPDESFPRVASLLVDATRRRVPEPQAVRMIAEALRDGRSLRRIELLFAR